jgi:hypothetical protein
MADDQTMKVSDLYRQTLDVQRGFALLENAISTCDFPVDLDPVGASVVMRIRKRQLVRALSLIRDLQPPLTPPDRGDELAERLKEVDMWVEGVLGSLFYFRKEWEEDYACELEGRCAELHKASQALVKHLEDIGFA